MVPKLEIAEENALEKRTGNHRGFVGPAKGTFDRVVAHDQDQDYKKLASLNYETFSRRALVSDVPNGVGPRQRAIDEALMKKAFEETKMEAPKRSYFTTSSGDAYVKKPFISKVGARVMKSLDGRPIPTEGRDNDFLVEFSLTKPKAKSKIEHLRNALPRGDYIKQGAITMYTQRISEGCYSSTSGSGDPIRSLFCIYERYDRCKSNTY